MKKSYNVVAILMTTLILSGLFATACGPKAPVSTGPITINLGVCEPLSGPAAIYGKLTQQANETFYEVFNRQGFKVGNQTYNFKEIVADDQATTEGAAAAAKKLVYEDGCKIIYGHWDANFQTIAAVTNPAKVIFFSHTGADAVPGPGGYDPKTMPYVAFPIAAHELVVAYVFGIVEANPNYKKIGIIDSVLDKGIGWDAADKQMDAKGIRYFHQFTQLNTTDFAPYITKCAEAGCDFIYTPDVTAALFIPKQRWELGYKDIKICSTVPISSVDTWIKLAGNDAIQGFITSWGSLWEVKNRPLNADQIAMFQETMRLLAEKNGGKYTYTGWTAWGPTQAFILSQAMQKAGTVDDNDAIMKVIRGGTFDLPTGPYTFSGAQTYGSPVVLVTGILECAIQGNKEVYYSEYALPPLP